MSVRIRVSPLSIEFIQYKFLLCKKQKLVQNAPIAQLVEASDLNPVQCEFESHQEYRSQYLINTEGLECKVCLVLKYGLKLTANVHGVYISWQITSFGMMRFVGSSPATPTFSGFLEDNQRAKVSGVSITSVLTSITQRVIRMVMT